MRICVGLRTAAIAGAFAFQSVLAQAAPPAPEPVTPQLIEAAKKEGKVVFYTAVDLKVAQGIAKLFETKYPGITVQVERTGSERLFQRVAQERAAKIYTVDVLDATDEAMFIAWKHEGILEPYIPTELTKYPATARDPDGTYNNVRFTLMPIGVNNKLVKPEDMPKSYADLLDPKWSGKMVKGHPSYSGSILTSTFQIEKAIGWQFFDKLGKQKVLQVQSATEPPKKLSLGERAVSADGLEYVHLGLMETGAPISLVYPTEGTPFIPSCEGIAKNAPHPNAAKLFISFMFSLETQQYLVNDAHLRSFHPDVKEKEGLIPLSKIKLLPSDAEAQEKAMEDIKKKYSQAFGI